METNKPTRIAGKLGIGCRTILWCAVMLSLLFVATGFAAAQDVHKTIQFQGRLTYLHTSNVITQVMSNQLKLNIKVVYGATFVGSGDPAVMPGGRTEFVYTLTNTGNTADTFSLSHEFPVGSGLTATWWYDMDGNGRLNNGDIPFIDTNNDGFPDTGPLSPGASRRLLLSVSVDPNASFAVHEVTARATSTGDPTKTFARTNKLEVTNSAPYISVSSAPAYVYEGEQYVLPIEYGNTGTQSVQALAITAPLSPLVSYVDSSPQGVYDALTHSVTWPIGSIAAGTEYALTLTLEAQEGHGPGHLIENKARLAHSGVLVLESTAMTELATRAPNQIEIYADPQVIRADGKAISVLTAGIADMVGNPVEDNTVITFKTKFGTLQPRSEHATACDPGEFAEGESCLRSITDGGVASVDLLAAKIESDEHTIVEVTVSAWNPDTGLVSETLKMYFSPGAIVGRLVNVATKLPEAGVEVRLVRIDAQGNPVAAPVVRYTDANGYYVFPVPEGEYRLTMHIKNDAGVTEEIELPRLAVAEAFDAVTHPPVNIRGRLTDAATGEGIGLADVDLFNEHGQLLGATKTDAQGFYVFSVSDAFGPQGFAPMNAGQVVMGQASGMSPQAFVSAQSIVARPTWRVRARSSDGRGADAVINDVRPGDFVMQLNMLVEPLGIVRDKLTNLPVDGASVSLVWAGAPLAGQTVVLPQHLGQAQPNPQVTDAQGVYKFFVTPGYYRLGVEAPGYHAYVSDPMVIQGDQISMLIHIEPLGAAELDIAKDADPYPQVGTTLTYTLRVENTSNRTLPLVIVEDLLPNDLNFVAGTASHGGVYDGGDRTLTWNIANLTKGQIATVSYQVVVGNVPEGTQLTNVARAQVHGEVSFASTTHTVQVADWPEMRVTKSVDQDLAGIGDVIEYEVELANESDVNSGFAVSIEDALPQGFTYVEGSTRIDGAVAADPIHMGGSLYWEIGDMPPGSKHTLRYAAVITLGASDSDGINRAYAVGEASGGFSFRMGPGEARTRVQDGLFGFDGRIVGRVFVDTSGDGFPDPGEPGLAGVELILDDGRSVVTDANGFFTINQVHPGARSLKLVERTLPDGASVVNTVSASALGGWSQWVNVRPADVAIVDFAVSSTTGGGVGGSGRVARQGDDSLVLVGTVDSWVSLSERGAASVHGSFYMQNEYADGGRLTLRYDPRRGISGAAEEALLPPMNLQWDRSRVSDLAPSADPFYARFERGSNFLMYGDITPGREETNRFTRRPGVETGIAGRYIGDVSLQGYAFSNRRELHRELIPGAGVSGLYYLTRGNLIADSAEVSLVTFAADDAELQHELGRTLLVRGRDYTVDNRMGALWFTAPVPSYNEAFDRVVIDVAYSTPALTGDGGAYGLRLQVLGDERATSTLSYAAERAPGIDHAVVGLDGKVNFAEQRTRVAYEVATQIASASHDPGSVGAFTLTVTPSPWMRVGLRAQAATGAFVRPGETSAVKRGVQATGSIELQLTDGVRARYERGLATEPGAPNRHSDRLQLATKLSPQLETTLSVRSAGLDISPFAAEREAGLGVSAAWRPTEVGVVEVNQEFQLRAGSAAAHPTSVTYRQEIARDLFGSVRYQGALGGGVAGAWSFALESVPKGGPRIYSRYDLPSAATAGASTAVVGVANEWQLTPGLSLGVSAENIARSNESQSTLAGSWTLGYVYGEPLRLALQQEIRSGASISSRTVRFSADGRVDNGMAYQFRASWLDGGGQAADGSSLSRETYGELTWREPVIGRGFGAMQFLQRTYERAGTGSFATKRSEVGVIAGEAGYRLTPTVAVSGKLAYKGTLTDWSGNAAGPIPVEIALQQLGVQFQLGVRNSFDAFARRLQDSWGSEVFGYALELGHSLTDQLAVGVGYSTLGVDDPDVRAVVDWPQGLYLRVKLKF